jgi:Mce-associated membrane protein
MSDNPHVASWTGSADAETWARSHYANGADALSVEGFVRGLAADVQIIGGGEEVNGLEAARESARALFSTLDALTHDIHSVTTPSTDTLAVDATVTYSFVTGHQVSLPVITTMEKRDGLVVRIRIDIDSAAVRDALATDVEATEPADDTGSQDDAAAEEPSTKAWISPVRLAVVAGLTVVVALAALTGWLGSRAYTSHQADHQRKLFLQVGRQGALNLTTIDWQQADTDVQRILDSAMGTFRDDFQQRSAPFIDVVKKAQSKSVGTVTEAGLESESDHDAQVLVAVSVTTSNAGAAEQQPRAWRMRLAVQQVGDEAKVSNVEFVP